MQCYLLTGILNIIVLTGYQYNSFIAIKKLLVLKHNLKKNKIIELQLWQEMDFIVFSLRTCLQETSVGVQKLLLNKLTVLPIIHYSMATKS